MSQRFKVEIGTEDPPNKTIGLTYSLSIASRDGKERKGGKWPEPSPSTSPRSSPSRFLGKKREFLRMLRFDVDIGDRIVFTAPRNHPFAVFFRYGQPDGGDFDNLDEEKQIRSVPIHTKGGRKESASVRALKQGLFSPVVVACVPKYDKAKYDKQKNCRKGDPEEFIYDRSLFFEVHPIGS